MLASLDRRVMLGLLAHQGQLVDQDLRVMLEPQGLRVDPVPQDTLALQEQRDPQAQQAQLEWVYKVRRARQETEGYQGWLVQPDPLAILECRENQAVMEQRVKTEHLVCLETMDNVVQRVSQVPQVRGVPQGSEVAPDPLVEGGTPPKLIPQ